MSATFFANSGDFRDLLQKNHLSATELLVGFYKVGSGRESMTWPESVDEALCFGWIDGVRRRIDDESYSIRFTPRKSTSIWSAVNINKVDGLVKSGRMQPAGLAAFEKRTENNSKIYAYENASIKLSAEFENIFRANKTAWDFFTLQAPSYQKTVLHRIMNAKQEKTRLSRLGQAITESEKRKRII